MMTRSEVLPEERPVSFRIAVLSAVLGIIALMGVSSVIHALGWVILVDDFVWSSAEGRRITVVLPLSLLIGGAALWGLMRLKPWGAKSTSVSPTTRKTNNLFYLANLIAAPGMFALVYSTFSRDNPWAFLSNSAISPAVAIFVITSFLLSLAIGWRWYYTADEHERRANDFGFLAGGGVFMAVTPAWWIAARAGLLPQPDAMVLWLITMVVMTIGWFWHRYR
jgi:hypothetical protein